ncbi:hypothetical protein [Gloeobacter kilaueensis]|uniref:Uncharacterized protein n=1 Tax=Gloeobacter kilaueensis (strain ATCC BAA-2537 / CCAP 1431/1 / ULC 316 / JS1) TaxID=1183438 RepID=U5QLA5_GLOK1|nr:hypothetical protein [Gloeobacter kilaueensis]AGY59772.1 hypothetical protein GKIL_3526 [Gloeobacter kilaueensis JS1]
MSNAEDKKIDERLERALPSLLTYHPYDYQRDIAAFRDEEEALDQEIDRVWEKAVERQAVPVRTARFPQWWGAVAAGFVAAAGLAGVLMLGRSPSTPNTGTALTLPNPAAQFDQLLAAELRKQWQPDRTATGDKAVLSARLVPGPDGLAKSVEWQLVHSSGDAQTDRLVLESARRTSAAGTFDRLRLTQPRTLLASFEPATGKVSVSDLP